MARYCPYCGKKIYNYNETECPYCYKPLPDTHNAPRSTPHYPYSPQKNSEGSFGWWLLGFFIPIIGLILYLSWKNSDPGNAQSAGKGALTSVLISILLIFTIFFLPMCLSTCSAIITA